MMTSARACVCACVRARQWEGCVGRAEARLGALFSAMVAVDDYDFEHFDEVRRQITLKNTLR